MCSAPRALPRQIEFKPRCLSLTLELAFEHFQFLIKRKTLVNVTKNMVFRVHAAKVLMTLLVIVVPPIPLVGLRRCVR